MKCLAELDHCHMNEIFKANVVCKKVEGQFLRVDERFSRYLSCTVRSPFLSLLQFFTFIIKMSRCIELSPMTTINRITRVMYRSKGTKGAYYSACGGPPKFKCF